MELSSTDYLLLPAFFGPKHIAKIWKKFHQRDLSVYGRITIAKTLGLSKLLFSSACICTPAHVIDKVNRLIVNFVWRGKKPKIKSDALIGSKDQGGLDLPEYDQTLKSVLILFILGVKFSHSQSL